MIRKLGQLVRIALVVTLLGPWFLSGCTSLRPRPSPETGKAEVTVVGDWNDVEAALYAVVGEVEMAILSKTERPDEQTFELLSVGDEQGFVYARRAPGDQNDRIPITLTCSLGFFGDAASERALLTAMAARLKDLAGVGSRPIR